MKTIKLRDILPLISEVNTVWINCETLATKCDSRKDVPLEYMDYDVLCITTDGNGEITIEVEPPRGETKTLYSLEDLAKINSESLAFALHEVVNWTDTDKPLSEVDNWCFSSGIAFDRNGTVYEYVSEGDVINVDGTTYVRKGAMY